MSTNALEKALWQIGTSPADTERYRADPQAYAAAFRLDDAERTILAELDVGAMARRDTSTLLLMMAFLAVRGPDSMGEYMQSMHRPA
ncbi:hypothetical protein JN531_005670 [Flagellatimonas centrodinii]|uniref:hypothetical protein n=1 Tax=Flagellatimonas centrodinii TaxID=2806210 RepID=UPI001FEEB310|nr:hypothetical protein [Flagellatimonas centrodinii]ULQ47777.1 hypothetical protein JN531_005670 [Flagellatimonas centrodinii]